MVPFGLNAAPSPYAPTVSSAGLGASAVQDGSGSTPATARPVAPVAPTFFNPRFSFDRDLGLLIMQVRDDATGEVVTQFPSEKAVKEYRRQQSRGDSAQVPANDEEAAAPAAEEQPRPARIEIEA